jgi:hypothetical protein
MSKVASMKAERARWVLDPNNQDQRTVGLPLDAKASFPRKRKKKNKNITISRLLPSSSE